MLIIEVLNNDNIFLRSIFLPNKINGLGVRRSCFNLGSTILPLAIILSLSLVSIKWKYSHLSEVLWRMSKLEKTCHYVRKSLGFLGGASGKELTCQGRRHRRQGFNPRVGKIPWKRAWQPIPVFLSGESHGQRSLVGYSPKSRKKLERTEHT